MYEIQRRFGMTAGEFFASQRDVTYTRTATFDDRYVWLETDAPEGEVRRFVIRGCAHKVYADGACLTCGAPG